MVFLNDGVPKGGKEKKTITEYYQEKRRDQKEKARMLEAKWDLMKDCVTYLEENEEWFIASMMERMYDEER